MLKRQLPLNHPPSEPLHQGGLFWNDAQAAAICSARGEVPYKVKALAQLETGSFFGPAER